MKKTQTKAKMIENVAKKLKVSRTEAGRIYDCFAQIINESIKNHESVSLFGVGTLHVVKRDSYVGVNPNTGEKWTLPDSYHTKFNASGSIKKALKNKQ